MSDADELIRLLGLKPHPEGGHFRETFRDGQGASRALSTAIYFLLKEGELSHWHRIDAVEVWHFYAGAPLELSIAEDREHPQRLILGADVGKGQAPQIVVPAQAWQIARTLGSYTLAGCTVAPGFEFSKFEMAPNR